MSSGREVDVRSLDVETLEQIVTTLEPLLTARRQLRIEDALASRTRDVVLVLEDIANEHNGAAVLRTAEAFGFFEVHVIEPQSGRFKISERISKGTEKWLELHRYQRAADAYATLRAQSRKIFASTLHGDAIDVAEIPIDAPVALVFGNELLGLSPDALARADGYFRIPMSGFVESFNISVAAAISAYDLFSRRRARGLSGNLTEDDRRRVRAAWLAQAVKSAPAVLERAALPVPVLHTHRFTLIAEDGSTPGA